jgi:hypothetical protein
MLKQILSKCGNEKLKALFACLMSCTFSASEQCFSLTTNQRTVLSALLFSEANRTKSQSILKWTIMTQQNQALGLWLAGDLLNLY